MSESEQGPATSDDPGWRPAVVIAIPVPGLVQWKLSRPGVDGLVAIRVLFTTFANAVVMIGIVVVILTQFGHLPGTLAPAPIAVAVVLIGVVAQVVGRIAEHDLDCRDESTLALSYRTRFFLRIACTDVGALVAFIGVMLTNVGPIYLAGLAVSAVGFIRCAPTRAHLADDQRALAAAGCALDLVGALRRGTLRPQA